MYPKNFIQVENLRMPLDFLAIPASRAVAVSQLSYELLLNNIIAKCMGRFAS